MLIINIILVIFIFIFLATIVFIYGGFLGEVVKPNRIKEIEHKINKARGLFKKLESDVIKLKKDEKAEDYLGKIWDEINKELSGIEDEADRGLAYLIIADKKISWYWNKEGKISIEPSKDLEKHLKKFINK